MANTNDRIGRAVRSHVPVDGSKAVTTAASRDALSATSLPVDWIAITAKIGNTGTIVVGASTVVAAEATRRGHPLLAGVPMVLGAVDLADIYIDATVSGEGITYLYLT